MLLRFYDVALALLQDTISQWTHWSTGSYNLFAPFLEYSWNLRCRNVFLDVVTGSVLHDSKLWLVIIFSPELPLLQREVSLMKGENYSYQWIKTNIYNIIKDYAALTKYELKVLLQDLWLHLSWLVLGYVSSSRHVFPFSLVDHVLRLIRGT